MAFITNGSRLAQKKPSAIAEGEKQVEPQMMSGD
jgi:hypothetical protein